MRTTANYFEHEASRRTIVGEGHKLIDPGSVPAESPSTLLNGGAADGLENRIVHPAATFNAAVSRLGPDRYRGETIIVNAMGLHVRPASEFARLALLFECDVIVHMGNQQVDGKSAMDLLTLAAEQGTPLVLEAAGPDADRAIDALLRLVASGFGE